MTDNPYDIVIIGGGPAGLTAALYAARALRRTLLLEKKTQGGQIALTHLVENYPGFAEGIGGYDLAEAMAAQAERYGAEIGYEPAVRLEREAGGFRVITESGGLRTRAVIVTAGAEYRRLGVPGEDDLTGRGVSYCATCDAAFFRDMDVAVVGGGDAAMDEALFIARYAARIHVVHRRNTLRASRVLQERAFAEPKIDFIWNAVVESIDGEGEVHSLALRDVRTGERRELAVSGAFIFIGQTPESGFLHGLAPTDAGGHLLVDLMMRTPVEGLFAAGDVRAFSARQAVSAAGDGATAAIAAEQYLAEHYGAPVPRVDARLL